MKPFSLSTVLRYRQQIEDTAVIKLNEARQEMAEKESVLSNTNVEYNDLLNKYSKHQEQGIRLADLLHFENRLCWLKEKIVEFSQDLKLAQAKVERKRQIVVAKSRDKKALEQLKERQDAAWKIHTDKKETAHLDEISVIAHLRKEQNH